MIVVNNTTVGENKGKPRIWLEGKKLSYSFSPNDLFDTKIDKVNKRIEFVKSPEGSHKVSVRRRNNTEYPVIDFKSEEITEMFSIGMLLRVVIRNGKVTIEMHSNDKKRIERVSTILRKLATKEPLALGSICTGAGILDKAIHTGLKDCGISSYAKFIVERERKYVDALLANQPDMFTENSIIVESDIELVDLTGNGDCQIDIFISGLPCNAASKAGKTKNKISAAEFHKDAGSAFHYWLNFVNRFQPSVIVLENVPEFLATTSMAVIRSVLDTYGYSLHDKILNGNDFGSLEGRNRMCMVAVTKGLEEHEEFSFENMIVSKQKEEAVNEVLEVIPNDDPRWKSYKYLADKEVRDSANGRGFKRSLYNGCEGKVITIRRLYHKGGSCDPFVIHPLDSTLSRLFTPIEHARIKGIPEEMDITKGLSATTAHEILGQGVIFPKFRSVGHQIGSWLMNNLKTA